MLTWMSTGMFIFEEYKTYDAPHLAGILLSAASCLFGVKFLTMKRIAAKMGDDTKEDDPTEDEEKATAPKQD